MSGEAIRKFFKFHKLENLIASPVFLYCGASQEVVKGGPVRSRRQCKKAELCGIAVYERYSGIADIFVPAHCICPSGFSCAPLYKDLAVTYYMYYCEKKDELPRGGRSPLAVTSSYKSQWGDIYPII